MIYGYARVSTRGQARDGNSIEGQENQLRDAGCEVLYAESCTGTRMDRPKFTELMSRMKRGDRLVVTKLDRFARTTSGGIDTIRNLLERGVSVHILNMGLIDNTPTGRLMVTMLLAFAEFERDMIVERTSSGKAIARENNPDFREGRRKKEVDGILYSELREKNKKGILNVMECCRQLGISKGTWYNMQKATI